MPSPREGTTNLVRYLTKALQCVTITNQGSEGEIQETGGREGEEKGEGENNQNGGQHEDSLPFLNKHSSCTHHYQLIDIAMRIEECQPDTSMISRT